MLTVVNGVELTQREEVLFHDCQGNCHICLLEGGCELENKLKESVRARESAENSRR